MMMWGGSKEKRKIDLRGILQLNDEPHKIAASLAVGVFISFSPFYGAHMLLALGLAFLFRLNKAATLAGTWAVLPWFAPFMLGLAYLLGRFLMGQGIGFPQEVSLEATWILQNLLPLLLGCSLLGVVAAGCVYAFSRRAIVRWKRINPGEGASTPP